MGIFLYQASLPVDGYIATEKALADGSGQTGVFVVTGVGPDASALQPGDQILAVNAIPVSQILANSLIPDPAKAQKWNFPSEYCEVISNHHSPQKATLDPTLSAIVNLADYFCSVRQLDYGGRGWVSFNLADEGAWEVLKKFAPHMRNFDVERFCYELDDRVPEIQEMVKSIFEDMVVQ